jgi:transporter family-2 protein
MGTEAPLAFIALAPLVGALVTVMNGVNSRFSSSVGNLVSTLVIHIAGLAAVSVLLAAGRESARPGKAPFYFYLGGLVGVGTVFSCNYTFAALGASLAVTLSLLGQTLFSVAADASGFLGRKKYPLSARSLPGIGLAVAGVAVMAGDRRSDAAAMLVALASGALPSLSFILNSELGRRKGIVRSTRVNYLVGLGTTLVVVAAVRPPAAEALRAVAAAGPFLALGGGLMGVAIVAATNLIFPRIPAFSATLLLFSGQAFAGVAIDFLAAGAFDARKVIGALLLLAGLAINALLARKLEGKPIARPFSRRPSSRSPRP